MRIVRKVLPDMTVLVKHQVAELETGTSCGHGQWIIILFGACGCGTFCHHGTFCHCFVTTAGFVTKLTNPAAIVPF